MIRSCIIGNAQLGEGVLSVVRDWGSTLGREKHWGWRWWFKVEGPERRGRLLIGLRDCEQGYQY